MDIYSSPGTTRIDGPIFGAVAIDNFAPGATIQYGQGKPVIPVNGRDVEYAPAGGWDAIILSGNIAVKVYRAPLPNNERPGARSQQSSTGGVSAVGGLDAGGTPHALKTLGDGTLVCSDSQAQGAPGAAAPPQAVQIEGTDGANGRALLVDAAGRPRVAVDHSGRPTYAAAIALNLATLNAFSYLNAPPAGVCRVRRVRLLWPGKVTAAAKAAIALFRTDGTPSPGGGVAGAAVTRRNRGDALPGSSVTNNDLASSYVGVSYFESLDSVGPWIPAADGPFTPVDLFNADSIGAEPIVVQQNARFGLQNFAAMAGADGNFAALVEFTVEPS